MMVTITTMDNRRNIGILSHLSTHECYIYIYIYLYIHIYIYILTGFVCSGSMIFLHLEESYDTCKKECRILFDPFLCVHSK